MAAKRKKAKKRAAAKLSAPVRDLINRSMQAEYERLGPDAFGDLVRAFWESPVGKAAIEEIKPWRHLKQPKRKTPKKRPSHEID